jgi:hypothetical protein
VATGAESKSYLPGGLAQQRTESVQRWEYWALRFSLAHAQSPMNAVFLTALLGFVGGCAAVVFSKLIIDPYLEYRGVLKAISRALIFHAGLIVSAPFPKRDDLKWSRDEYEKAREEHLSVSREVRELAARLKAPVTLVLRFLRLVPPRETLNNAAGRLIRISNSILQTDKKFEWIFQDMVEVGVLLKIDINTN